MGDNNSDGNVDNDDNDGDDDDDIVDAWNGVKHRGCVFITGSCVDWHCSGSTIVPSSPRCVRLSYKLHSVQIPSWTEPQYR